MIIGVSGHQNLGNKDSIKWLKKEISSDIKKILVNQAYSCLAKGADQLFADIVLENAIPLIGVIPCKDYEKTFDKAHINQYFTFLKKSTSIIELQFSSPSEEAFYYAGKKIVEKIDILFTIWNNKPAKGLGGTADIVDYAKKLNIKIIHYNPDTKIKNFINYA